MNRKIVFWMEIVGFSLAVLLLFMGIIIGFQLYSYLDGVTEYDGPVVLIGQMRWAAISSIISGVMVIIGTGLLLYLGLKLFHKTIVMEREAEALRKKNEAIAKVIRQTRELAHHQRLETIGMLTSSIAHEFNNLLTPIMGYSLMALEKLPPEEEELYDNILEVYNASRTAKNLISRLSDLSRKNTDATFRMASPDDLVRRTVEVASPAKPEKVEIRLDLSCQDQRLKVNEIQIQQLMLNLILNAFQAMEGKGGILTVKTSFDDRNVYLHVRDTGCGISEENRARIFDPFFTTKESGRGTGLGLAIAAQVAEDHQGSIRVDSRVGEGTAFTVKLPRDR